MLKMDYGLSSDFITDLYRCMVIIYIIYTYIYIHIYIYIYIYIYILNKKHYKNIYTKEC